MVHWFRTVNLEKVQHISIFSSACQGFETCHIFQNSWRDKIFLNVPSTKFLSQEAHLFGPLLYHKSAPTTFISWEIHLFRPFLHQNQFWAQYHCLSPIKVSWSKTLHPLLFETELKQWVSLSRSSFDIGTSVWPFINQSKHLSISEQRKADFPILNAVTDSMSLFGAQNVKEMPNIIKVNVSLKSDAFLHKSSIPIRFIFTSYISVT